MMKTIALRFSDGFAPEGGTIAEHKKYIEKAGFVWFGKLGASVSDKTCREILENKHPRILLIHSGKISRYWAYIDKISKDIPATDGIPEYYREQANLFHTWFRIIKITNAEKDVMSACRVASSGVPLSQVSRSSMSPYFIIEYKDQGSEEG